MKKETKAKTAKKTNHKKTDDQSIIAPEPFELQVKRELQKPILSRTVVADKTKQFLRMVCKSLDNDKAEEIVTIDLRGKTSMADYMVVASGNSVRQLSAMADHIGQKAKSDFQIKVTFEGKGRSDWILIDAGNIIINLFKPEVRDIYHLEKLWENALPPDQIDEVFFPKSLKKRSLKKNKEK